VELDRECGLVWRGRYERRGRTEEDIETTHTYKDSCYYQGVRKQPLKNVVLIMHMRFKNPLQILFLPPKRSSRSNYSLWLKRTLGRAVAGMSGYWKSGDVCNQY